MIRRKTHMWALVPAAGNDVSNRVLYCGNVKKTLLSNFRCKRDEDFLSRSQQGGE